MIQWEGPSKLPTMESGTIKGSLMLQSGPSPLPRTRKHIMVRKPSSQTFPYIYHNYPNNKELKL